MSNFEKLQEHVFVTKLAGFEHTKYIQNNETHEQVNEDDIPLVQGKNIRNGFFVDKYDWYIRKEISDALERSKLNKICILIPYVGSNLGEVGIFYHEYDCHMASNIAKVELIDEHFDIEFLKYYLQSDIGQAYLFQAKQGSAQPNITMEAIRNTLVIDLDINLQRKIAKVLKSIDDKIVNNYKINAELESIAKTIYDYWFLQFDFPDENGKPYKSFGGKMVWNEELKREIPENWENGTLEDLGEIVAGGTPSTEHSEYYCKNGIAWITPNDLANSHDKYITHGERDISEIGLVNSSAKLMPKGTVLLTSRAPIGYIGIAINEICTNQGFKSIVPNEKFGSEFIYYTIQKMIEYLKSLGTGSTFTEISKNVVAKVKIVLPEEAIVKNFETIMSEISSKRRILEEENKELKSLRNFLLPLLMNGQVGFN